MKDTITCNALLIYHYDFVNKEGRNVKSSKLLVKICDHFYVYINAKGFEGKKLYTTQIVEVYFDGKEWKIK